MAKVYQLIEPSIHSKFMSSRLDYQFFGGGYGNGKTSAMVVKALQIAKDYPGCSILMARSTYPKLNDTLRKTFIEFCPPEWIKSFPMSKNSENTCTLENGSTFNFRYIAQRKSTEDGGSTSNLLSATYDLIVVDQLEDPEIIHKDFLDLIGRLRGSTIYRGDDPTMPRTGPRWMLLSSNPTRNWVFHKLINPLKKYLEHGIITDDLLCEKDDEGKIVLRDGKPIIMIDLIEGSTYENKTLPKDFIKKLESSYTGQMRDRFLKGQWAAYEGLVYPQYQSTLHSIRHDRLLVYMRDQILKGARLEWIASYDFGMVSPSCYLLAFTDIKGNTLIVDGYYEKEVSIEWQAKEMVKIGNRYGMYTPWIYADPDIFRRKAGDHRTVGKAVTDLFADVDSSLLFTRGDNNIASGISKVSAYLEPREYHLHPITGEPNAPMLYHSDRLTFIEQEITSYYWTTDSSGERDDTPTDRNDHAMDAIKYLLSHRPEPATLIVKPQTHLPPFMTGWTEINVETPYNQHRH